MSISFAPDPFLIVLSTDVDCDTELQTEPFETTRVVDDEFSTQTTAVDSSTVQITNLL
jgi:hypothetical protein